MLVGRRRRLCHRFLPEGVVLEALLVADAPVPAPTFASIHLHRTGCIWSLAPLRWRMLCRCFDVADALPPSSRWLKFAWRRCFAAVVG